MVVKTPRQVIVTFLDDPELEAVCAPPPLEKFEQLFDEWYADTAPHSNPEIIFGHQAFLQIIELGEAAIPLIFKKIQEKDSLILAAMPRITGQSPVPKAHFGKFFLIKKDWLNWGIQNGYIQ